MTSRRRPPTFDGALIISSDSESDTSLVLEDLVRIGEASRLRRRGALRLDTTATATAAPDDSLLSGLVATAHATGSQPRHRVFCGARDWAHAQAPNANPIPGCPDDDEDEDADEQPWTGCRALVHDGAVPAVRDGTWFARGAAQPTVVRLSPAFFERGGRRVRRPCGCASDGVGCRVCGNALGIEYRPCERHQRLFPAGARPLYSFFDSATHAQPPFAFPPPTVAPPPLNSPSDAHSLPASPVDDVIELLEPLESPKY